MPITVAPTACRPRTNSRWLAGNAGSTKITFMLGSLRRFGRFVPCASRWLARLPPSRTRRTTEGEFGHVLRPGAAPAPAPGRWNPLRRTPVRWPARPGPRSHDGIVGLILAIFCSLVGLIVSIIAFNKSKAAGFKNNIALAGIIVGAVFIVLNIIYSVTVLPGMMAQMGG